MCTTAMDDLERLLRSKPKADFKPISGESIPLRYFSSKALNVLDHFGVEAPHLLNEYCCALEDALIKTAKRELKLHRFIKIFEEQCLDTAELEAAYRKAKADLQKVQAETNDEA